MKTFSKATLALILAGTINSSFADIVSEKPAGEELCYEMSTTQVYGGDELEYGGILMKAVRDGDVFWFEDIVTACGFGTWTKAEMIDGKLCIKNGQHIYHQDPIYNYGEYDFYIVGAEYSNNRVYITDEEYTTFRVGRDGSFELPQGKMLAVVDNYGGLLASNNGYYLSPFNPEEAIVTPPSHIENETYCLHYQDGLFHDDYYKLVEVKNDVDANKFYVKGLCGTYGSDSWTEGMRRGDYMVFPSAQFQGIAEEYFLDYFYSGYESFPGIDGFELDRELTFSWEKEGEKLISQGVALEMIGDRILVGGYLYPELTKYKPHEAVPAKAKMMDFTEYPDFKVVRFTISPIDEVGDYINPEGIEWRLFADGKPYTFLPEYYLNLNTQKEIFKWGETDGNWDIVFEACGLYNIWLYEDIKYIQVEVTFTHEGKSHTVMSERMILDEASVSQVSDETNGKEYIFDLNGIKRSEGDSGILINRKKAADGSVKSYKILKK